MSEMIERVAKALFANRPSSLPFAEWDDLTINAQTVFLAQARAAIEAMREPTDAMVGAADSDWGPQLRDNWREMIDAALGKVVVPMR